jgi:glutamate dehydrogenase (NAD(P)+)
VYNANGLDTQGLRRYVSEHGGVGDFPGAESIASKEFFELGCDVLVPAALEGQITEANADSVRAHIIVEGANGPTTPEADRVLQEKGVLVVPDILANAGGVTVSYFEWVQGLQFHFWSETEINQRLEERMDEACSEVWSLSEAKGVSLRLAALMLAIQRVHDATIVRGIYP